MTFAPLEVWIKKTRYEYKALAKALGVSRAAITHWKNRNVVPKKHQEFIRKLLKTKNGLG